jgi:hypothetical protein
MKKQTPEHPNKGKTKTNPSMLERIRAAEAKVMGSKT